MNLFIASYRLKTAHGAVFGDAAVLLVLLLALMLITYFPPLSLWHLDS